MASDMFDCALKKANKVVNKAIGTVRNDTKVVREIIIIFLYFI